MIIIFVIFMGSRLIVYLKLFYNKHYREVTHLYYAIMNHKLNIVFVINCFTKPYRKLKTLLLAKLVKNYNLAYIIVTSAHFFRLHVFRVLNFF